MDGGVSPDALTTHRDALRLATRAAHDAAERRWFPDGAFTTKHVYLSWLDAMAQLHTTFGLPSARFLCCDVHVTEELSRSAALRNDTGRHPDMADPVAIETASQALGILYVLNGSAMGASMLMKPGVLPDVWPRAYLANMRSYATSGRLKSFLTDLNTSPLDRDAAANGARQVFTALSHIG